VRNNTVVNSRHSNSLVRGVGLGSFFVGSGFQTEVKNNVFFNNEIGIAHTRDALLLGTVIQQYNGLYSGTAGDSLAVTDGLMQQPGFWNAANNNYNHVMSLSPFNNFHDVVNDNRGDTAILWNDPNGTRNDLGYTGGPVVPPVKWQKPVMTGSITLHWQHNPYLSITGYRIYRSTASGQIGSLLTVLGLVTQYTDNTTQQGGIYYYTITSIDGNNIESAPSIQIVHGEPVLKTVTFGETGTDTYNDLTFDTHLRQVQPTRNYGVVDNIRVKNLTNDEWRGLLKFDFRPGLLKEGVRDTSEITSALITLKLSQSEDTQNRNLYIYKVNKDWGDLPAGRQEVFTTTAMRQWVRLHGIRRRRV